MGEWMDLMTHARVMGVKTLNAGPGRLMVEFYPDAPREKDEEYEDDQDVFVDPEELPAKRGKKKEEHLGAGVIGDEDAKTLMDPYHDLHGIN